MNKKAMIGIAVLAFLGLAAGGYAWWFKSRQTQAPAAASQAVTDIQSTIGSVSQRVAEDLYSDAAADSAASIPDVNPYRNTNPFSDIKTNPFE